METTLARRDTTGGAIEVGQSQDDRLVGLWLHGRSPHTKRAYRSAHARLMASVGAGVALAQVSLDQLQTLDNSLRDDANLSGASRASVLSGVKSLLAFGHKLGYLPFDVGRALRLPKHRDKLAERILDEDEVHETIQQAQGRDKTLLRVLYYSGVRVSEVCALKWSDAQARSEGVGQLSIYGKGGKTRVVLLPAKVWKTLTAQREGAPDDAPIFASRSGGGHLDPSQVLRIVQAAARRAGIAKRVSPHFFRHSHATHSIDHGCGIHTLSATLGHASIAVTGRYLHARPTDSSANYLR